MNLIDLHDEEKSVSSKVIIKGNSERLLSIQILASQRLKEHLTKTPALLTCVQGQAVFSNEQGVTKRLGPGDYINIEPMIKHWVDAESDSQLLLFK